MRRSLRNFFKLPEAAPAIVFVVLGIPAIAAAFLYAPAVVAWVAGGGLVLAGGWMVAALARAAFSARQASVEGAEIREVLERLDDGLVVYSEDFKVEIFNEAAGKLFGVDPKDFIGRVISAKDAAERGAERLAQVIFPSLAPSMAVKTPPGSYPQVMDVSFENPELDIRVTTAPLHDAEGRVAGFVKVLRDRTREISVLRSKNEFITIASHQLRSPLTDLSWAIDSLKTESGLSDSGKTIVDSASAAAKELLETIEDLLNISRIEEGRFGYNFARADLVQFIEKILADAAPRARRATVNVYFEHPENAPDVFIDAQKLSMAVVNLLDNAIRYNVQNGRVTVQITPRIKEPFVEVSVKDTGIGIPPEQMEKVFTKFFRAENAMKAQTQGSGLGLYIARNIVQAHGGAMWGESELGRGTTFHFTLPTDQGLIPRHEAPVDLG